MNEVCRKLTMTTNWWMFFMAGLINYTVWVMKRPRFDPQFIKTYQIKHQTDIITMITLPLLYGRLFIHKLWNMFYKALLPKFSQCMTFIDTHVLLICCYVVQPLVIQLSSFMQLNTIQPTNQNLGKCKFDMFLLKCLPSGHPFTKKERPPYHTEAEGTSSDHVIISDYYAFFNKFW